MYPLDEIFDFEINEKGAFAIRDKWARDRGYLFFPRIASAKTPEEKNEIISEAKKDQGELFRPLYSRKLNSCINYRYRKKGFEIYYVLLKDEQLSSVMMRKPQDKIVYVGMDAQTHRTKVNGKYPYPNSDFILNQILPADRMVVAGFHSADCVEKIARRAYNRGVDVLVDEDLTEHFGWRLTDRDFRVKRYPTYNPRKGTENREFYFELFMKARKDKPWLWQDYK